MTPEEKLAEIKKTLEDTIATVDKNWEQDENGNIIDLFYDGYRFAMAELLRSFFEETI